MCVGKSIGGQRCSTEDNDFRVGQLDEKPCVKIAVFTMPKLFVMAAVQNVPGKPENIGSTDPGQRTNLPVKCQTKPPDDQGNQKGDNGIADKNSTPLAQCRDPAVCHGGGKGTEVCRAGCDGGDCAEEQK